MFQCRPKPSQTRDRQSLVQSLRENCQDHPRRGNSYEDGREGRSYDPQGEGAGKLLQCKKIICIDARSRHKVDPTYVSAACSNPKITTEYLIPFCSSQVPIQHGPTLPLILGYQHLGGLYLIISWVTSVAVL